MSSWDHSSYLSTSITLDDLARVSIQGDPNYDSAVLKLVSETRSKGYDLICIPLTTDKWKTRWRDMCILPSGSEGDRDVQAEERAEAWRAGPVFMRDEVTMSRLGKGAAFRLYDANLC